VKNSPIYKTPSSHILPHWPRELLEIPLSESPGDSPILQKSGQQCIAQCSDVLIISIYNNVEIKLFRQSHETLQHLSVDTTHTVGMSGVDDRIHDFEDCILLLIEVLPYLRPLIIRIKLSSDRCGIGVVLLPELCVEVSSEKGPIIRARWESE